MRFFRAQRRKRKAASYRGSLRVEWGILSENSLKYLKPETSVNFSKSWDAVYVEQSRQRRTGLGNVRGRGQWTTFRRRAAHDCIRVLGVLILLEEFVNLREAYRRRVGIRARWNVCSKRFKSFGEDREGRANRVFLIGDQYR